jgi:beta-N-acetylhexosaminidase
VFGRGHREADDALMREGHARALTALGGARPPARTARLRVVTQALVPGDGVSEAGLPAAALRSLFAAFGDVEFAEVADLASIDRDALAGNGRQVVVASNVRARYAKGGDLRADLHLALWNPFQVLDIDAPAVVTWGYADGALDALRAWLEGAAAAPGRAPVDLTAGKSA